MCFCCKIAFRDMAQSQTGQQVAIGPDPLSQAL